MTLNFTPTTTFTLLFFFAFLSFSTAENKHALLIGIGDYDTSTGWQRLNSDNDPELLYNALVKQGFDSENIHQLVNKQASKENILSAIQSHLIEKIKKGDIVVFHYSGHGQQIQDNNGDEGDGLDEAIVPFNSPLYFEKGVYEGQKLIRDDELGDLFFKIRKKLGAKGHLLVIMDTCHSGSSTRGLGNIKGTDTIMASPKYIEELDERNKDKNQLEVIEQSDKSLASMVSLYSSPADQLSYEMTADDGKSYGLLSFAFSKYLNTLEKTTSYQGLMDKIKTFVTAKNGLQIPYLEGNPDQTVFGGKLLPPVKYYKVEEWFDKTIMTLNAGIVQGLHKGTKVSFYPVDTRNTNGVQPPLATGEIIWTKPFIAEVKLDTPLKRQAARAAWVFITERTYHSQKVRLKIEQNAVPLFHQELAKSNADSFIQIVEENPDVVIRKEDGEIQCLSRDSRELLKAEKPTIDELIAVCWKAANAQYLRDLEIDDERLRGEMKLIKTKGGEKTSISSVRIGAEYKLEIKNIGNTPFYFNIIDIQPDNVYSVVDNINPDNIKLNPGDSFSSPVLAFAVPLGLEVFKLFASPKSINILKLSTRSRGGRQTIRPGVVGVSTMTFTVTK